MHIPIRDSACRLRSYEVDRQWDIRSVVPSVPAYSTVPYPTPFMLLSSADVSIFSLFFPLVFLVPLCKTTRLSPFTTQTSSAPRWVTRVDLASVNTLTWQ